MATTIKIGHASISEKNSTSGAAGDSTGKEVYINPSYSIPGLKANVLLRPVSTEVARKSAKACEAGCKNSHIGYSQPGRGTLRTEAIKLNADLTKVNLASITTDCNCDCSSFMSICAEIGGAKIDQKSGIPTTHYMEAKFTKYGDYKAIKSSKYLTKSDYLKRGDILVRAPGHTVMVLENGSQTKEDADDITLRTNENIPEKIKFIDIDINKVSATNIEVQWKVVVKNSKSGKSVSNSKIVQNHDWFFKLTSITDTKITSSEQPLDLTGKTFKFPIDDLVPDTCYTLEILAKKKGKNTVKFSSQNLLFITPKAQPNSISNLKINLHSINTLNPKCDISFKQPTAWNTPIGGKSGYRVSLIVNGKVVAFNDELIKNVNPLINKTIYIDNISSGKLFTYGDVVQVGIQTWNSLSNKLFFDSEYPKCSEPFYITPKQTIINKVYLKIENTLKQVKFKRLVLSDKIKGV